MARDKKIIYIIEDDVALNHGIELTLGNEAYECRQFFTLGEIQHIEQADLVILDINLPDGNGFDYLKQVRKISNVPVLILTANDTELDEVMGLTLGADDYVTKPFGMMELISRIKAVLRRTQKDAQDPQDVIVLGDIEMNTKKHEVTADGEVVTLTLKEYELLKRLMKNPNIVMTRDCLLEDIWGYDFDGETRTVDVHVRTLRQKLGKSGEKIETVRGVGYRMSE